MSLSHQAISPALAPVRGPREESSCRRLPHFFLAEQTLGAVLSSSLPRVPSAGCAAVWCTAVILGPEEGSWDTRRVSSVPQQLPHCPHLLHSF